MSEYIITPPCNDDYIAASEYFSYIENRIYNEQRLAQILSDMKVFSESSVEYITEAKMGDKIMGRWNRFVEFIKGLIAKFTDSMTNILYSQKGYLEKNKDIILNRKPKDIEFSYEGDYEEGIKRMTNVKLPVFDYNTYHDEFAQDGNGPLVNKIMQGQQGWKYDEAREDDLSGQFKDYYLAKDKGTKSGKLSDLKFADLYNFCHDSNKVKNMVKADENRLTQSTDKIKQAITSQLGNTPANGNTTGENAEGGEETKEGEEEAAIIYEADDNNGGDKKTPAGSSNLQIKNVASSYNKDGDNADANNVRGSAAVANQENKNADDIQNMANRWIKVCQPMIAAKLTACQEISKCYMQLIRAHIRSYGGKGKKDVNNAVIKNGKKNAGGKNNNEEEE